MLIAAGVVGLLALGWGGVSWLRRSADGVVVRRPDPTLTEHFAAMVASADHAALSPRDRSARPSGAPSESLRADSGVLGSVEDATVVLRPKSPPEQQRLRRSTSMEILGPAGRRGTAVLTDLNPRIHDRYVLELVWSDGEETWLHLENARPEINRLDLDPDFPSGLVVAGPGRLRPCDLWSDPVTERMQDLAKRRGPRTALCDGDVLLRHQTQGSRTSRE